MRRVIILFVIVWSSIICQQSFSQKKEVEKSEIEILMKKREQEVKNEKLALKKKVVEINKKKESGEINFEQANQLKKEAAELHALNIENKLAIIDNSLALLKRKKKFSEDEVKEDYSSQLVLELGGENSGFYMLNHKSKYKYDIKTYGDMVIAFGLNNAIIDGQSLDDSPYKIGGSRFFEIGWAWNTRVFKNSNAVRFKYGLSFQYNGFKPKDNLYFVEDGKNTLLEEFPVNLKKSKFRMTNLVFPIHFEFGPSKKIESEHNFRYSTYNKVKFGIGGYAGFNIGTLQKLKYKQDGNRVKEKSRKSFNTNNFVYGVSAYIGKDDASFYVKYDLNSMFKSPNSDHNNISVGVRFDL